MSEPRLAAILLAAGESTRMGQLKQLLPWGGSTLIRWQIEQLQAAGVAEVIVVLGHAAETIAPAIEGCDAQIVNNAAYRDGRASSLRIGAAAVHTPDAIFVTSVDQPRPAWLFEVLAAAWVRSHARVVIPSRGGRRGHPTLLDGSLKGELELASEAELGLRAVVERHAVETELVEVGNSLVLANLNTPEEYEAALREYGNGGWSK